MGGAARRPAALAVAFLLVGSVGARAETPRPLWVLEVAVIGRAPQPDGPLRARLYSDAPAKLAAPLSGVVHVAPDHVVLDLQRAPVISTDVPEAPKPSFVVDYDTAAVARLAEDLLARHGAAPTDAQLVAFLRETVEPASTRGFDIASQVATHRSGDCTEHAVLFAALARSFGLPTRVVIGTVFVAAEERVAAFGHAWNELHRGGVWTLVDATPLEGARPVAYVPEARLANEGPGFALDLVSAFRSGIVRIELLGAGVADGSAAPPGLQPR